MAELDNRIMVRGQDGSTTYIPKEMVDISSITRDVKARMALAVVAGGALACGIVTATVAAVDFVRGCSNENVIRTVLGFPTATLAECLKESPAMFRVFLQQ